MTSDVTAGSPFDLRYLGAARVLQGEQPVDLVTRRTAGLLAYVACTGTPHTRTALASVFWPDRAEAGALGNLRVLLSNLRSRAPGLLDIDREAVVLAPRARAMVDVHRFDDAAGQGLEGEADEAALEQLRVAWSLYGGELLSGFALDVGPAFEQWLAAERTRLHLRVVQVLEALVDADLERGATTGTVALTHQLVDLDPWRESSQRRRMLAQWETGDPVAALADVERWLQRLRDELDLPPPEGLLALARRIRETRAPAPSASPPASAPMRAAPPAQRPADDVEPDPSSGLWPLVGRDHVLEAIARAVEEPSGPTAPSVVIAGAPGFGKSRLVGEGLAMATEQGHHVARIVATAAASEIPYGAVAHLAPDVEPADHRVPGTLHRAYLRVLQRADGGRLVLGVGDAHLLDTGSAALVLDLVVSQAATVILGLDGDRAAPDAITTLWKDGWAERIDLAPLSASEVARLLEAGLDGEVGRATRRDVAAATAGNPLFVRELALGAVAGGTLRRIDGVWRWDGEVVLAPRLTEAVDRMLGDCTVTERKLLALAALGGATPLALLERIPGAAALGRLERRGLLQVERLGNRIVARPGHPLYGEVALAQLGETVVRSLRRLLADHLERTDLRRAEDVMQLALLRLDAGVRVDPQTLTRAARLAIRSFDYPLAERLARAALEAGAGGHAVITLGAALHSRNRYEEADGLLAGWTEELLGHEEEALPRAWLRQRMSAIYLGLADADRAAAALVEAERGDRRARLTERIAAYRALLEAGAGRPGEAVRVGLHLLERADTDPQARSALPEVTSIVFGGCLESGRTDVARELAARVSAQATEQGAARDGHVALWQWLQEGIAMTFEGRVADALAKLEPLQEAMLDGWARSQVAVVASHLGRCHLMRGTVVSARRLLRDARTALDDSDLFGTLPVTLTLLARAHAALGDLEAAVSVAEEARRAVHPGHARRLAADLGQMDAWLAVADGRPEDGPELALQCADAFPESPGDELVLRHLALRLGAAAGPISDRMDAITPQVANPLLALFAEHARAQAAADPAALEAVAASFDELGLWVVAAEVERAAARWWQDTGEPGRAGDAADRAATLASRCEEA